MVFDFMHVMHRLYIELHIVKICTTPDSQCHVALLLVVFGSVLADIGWLKDLDLQLGILAVGENPFDQLRRTL